MKIHLLLSHDMILTELKSRTRDDTLREMVDFLRRRGKVRKGKELLEKLFQREKLGSTAIGEGVAVPHCKLKTATSPLFMLARSKPGVDFESLDGKPSHIFFLLVSSPDNPSLSLQILASIAQIVRKAGSLPRRILEAPDADAIIAVIGEEEGKSHA